MKVTRKKLMAIVLKIIERGKEPDLILNFKGVFSKKP